MNLNEAVKYLIDRIVATNVLTVNELAAIHGAAAPSAVNPFATISDIAAGTGDMTKIVYDSDNSGVVDDSELLQGNAGVFYLDRSNHTGTQSAATISDFTTTAQALIDASITAHEGLADPHAVYQLRSEAGMALGYVPLDASAKILATYLPDSIVGQVEYQGTWDAASNTPAIPASDATNKGFYYVSSSAVGSGHGYSDVPAVDFEAGDWIISNGTQWEKVDNSDAVTTVFGRLGNVLAVAGDYSASLVTNDSTVPGTNVDDALDYLITVTQPLDAELSALAGLTSAADKLPYFTGSGTAALTDLSSFARTLLDDAANSNARTTLGATAIGSSIFTAVSASAVRYIRINADDSITLLSTPTMLAAISGQPGDATLTALAGVVTAADKLIYSTAFDVFTTTDLSVFARTIIDDTSDTAMRATLGLGTGALLITDTDTNLAANSDLRVATQKAVKAYVDNAVVGLMELKGDTDCSASPNYPSALKGDAYYVTVAGKIGGASGKSVDIGDVYVAKADNAGGTEASVGTSWFVIEHNLAGVALTSGTLAQFASTTSAQLALLISDEVGTDKLVFNTSPNFTTDIRPTTNDGATLGTTALQWSDLFLAEGAVINFDNGDVTITQTGNVLSFAGATTRYEYDAPNTPSTNDGAALGTTALNWSDLFLATGGVINWNNGNATITHSAGVLSVNTVQFIAPQIGNSASTATSVTFDNSYYGKRFYWSPSGTATATLPANGANAGSWFEVYLLTAQTITITAATLDTLITLNDTNADSVAFSTAGSKIGALVRFESNGSVWIAVNLSNHTMTIAT